jgi:hypothetical protein
LSISAKADFLLTRKTFYVTMVLATAFSVVININQFLGQYVAKISFPLSMKNETVGNTTTLVTEYFNFYYIGTREDIYFSQASNYWSIIKYLFRDLGITITLLVVNLLILEQMGQSTKRRLKMAGAHKKANAAPTTTITATLTVVNDNASEPAMSVTASRSVMAAQKAERKRSIMIVLTGVNYIVGHSLNVVHIYNIFFLISIDPLWYCISIVAKILISLAYTTPLLFYYFFNTHFYKFTNANLKRLIIPVIHVAKLIKLMHVQDTSLSKEKSKNIKAAADDTALSDTSQF